MRARDKSRLVGGLYMGFLGFSFLSGSLAAGIYMLEPSSSEVFGRGLLYLVGGQLLLGVSGVWVGWLLLRRAPQAPVLFGVHNVFVVSFILYLGLYTGTSAVTLLLLVVIAGAILVRAHRSIRPTG